MSFTANTTHRKKSLPRLKWLQITEQLPQKKSNSRINTYFTIQKFFKNVICMTDKYTNASHSQKLLKCTTKIQCFIRVYSNVWRNSESNSNLKVQLHCTGRMTRVSSVLQIIIVMAWTRNLDYKMSTNPRSSHTNCCWVSSPVPKSPSLLTTKP